MFTCEMIFESVTSQSLIFQILKHFNSIPLSTIIYLQKNFVILFNKIFINFDLIVLLFNYYS